MITQRQILEEEKAKMTWMDRVFRRYPQVNRTSFISPPITTKSNQISLTPSLLGKVLVIGFILFASVFFIPLFNTLLSQKLPIIIPIGGIMFLAFIISFAVWYSFLNPEYNYKIFITADYIEANKQKHYWSEIADTYILRKMEGKTENKYLIIQKTDSKLIRLNLFKFRIHYKRLAGLIEHFKQETTAQQRHL